MARLANIPESVLQLAGIKSKELEEEAQEKGMENLYVDAGEVGNILISTVAGPATCNLWSRVQEWTSWTRLSPVLSSYSFSSSAFDPGMANGVIDGSFHIGL